MFDRRILFLATFLLVSIGAASYFLWPLFGADKIGVEPPFFPMPCGALGQACCRPPAASQIPADLGPIVGCQQSLGCDITSGKCVSPCGDTGQVCCDGPETRATKWMADGKLYSPNSWNIRAMCDAGACDRQTHRCFTCGTQDGGRCCPPDAQQATARCVGDRLECEFDSQVFATSGTCRACGVKGRAPCPWGCDTGLDLRNGLCDICSGDGQPPCDKGCKPGLGLAKGLCRQCGNNQQIPCDFGCRAGLGLNNGLCVVCGGQGQAPCNSGCQPGTRLINGVCTLCGHSGQPPCMNGCVYPLKVAGGVCRQCGANGQTACDTGCDQGLILSAGKCAKPGEMPPGESCAVETQVCVADFVTGTHCCQTGGPLLCVYGHCKACVPHGEEVKLGGTQICCNAKDGDVRKLDQALEKVICDIPDAPGK
jgi:hypothetical protein